MVLKHDFEFRFLNFWHAKKQLSGLVV